MAGQLLAEGVNRSLALGTAATRDPRMEVTMSLPRAKGRLITAKGVATIVAYCPLCGHEHRYGKGEPDGAEMALIRSQGFTDEWIPCQRDLPGNFWRIILSRKRADGQMPLARGSRSA